MTLEEYLTSSEMTKSDFAKMVPCSYSLPGMWIKGKANPSYKMACRIENVTKGLVPRTNWYPAPPKDVTDSIDLDIKEFLG